MSEYKSRVITFQDLGMPQETERISPVSFSTWIRVLLQNWRQGTVACKGRSDVARSNKKPWKQKGTGRARAGSARSPLWRGGGVIFGPMPRTRKLKVSAAVRTGVLRGCLEDLLKRKSVVCLDWQLSSNVPQTAQAYRALKGLGFEDKKVALIVRADDMLAQASFANLSNVDLLLFDQINAFDLAFNEHVLLLEKNFSDFKEVVSRWI